MDLLNELSQNIIGGDREAVLSLVRQALDEQMPVARVLNEGLIAGMNIVGQRFKTREMFLPEVLLAAKAMSAGIELLKPHLLRNNVPMLGKVVIGTVKGDLHDIGKTLVIYMLRGAGFEVIDLGKDVEPQKFIDAAREQNAQVIGMSALLTTTMTVMKQVVDLAHEQNVSAKLIVGGAPVSRQYAVEIGADAYAHDASTAVDRIRGLISAKPS